MGRKLSLWAFWLSLLIVVPVVPLIGAALGVVATVAGKNDPDSQTGIGLWAIPIGLIFGVFNTAITYGIVAHLGLV